MLLSLATVIVCLGQRLLGNGTLPLSLQQRVRVAVRLQRDLQLPILLTGGATHPSLPSTEAVAMYELARKLQNSSVCHLEEKATNTLENAIYSYDVVRRLGARQVHLVTNEFHAPRAARIFRHVMRADDIKVVVHTADSLLPLTSTSNDMPSLEKLLDGEIRSILGLNRYFESYGLPLMSNATLTVMAEEVEALRADLSRKCPLRDRPESTS